MGTATERDVWHSDQLCDDNLSIDPEFRELIPAMSEEEREQLEANVVEYGGARDPLIVWHRDDDDLVLLDGHNRLEICTRLKLRFVCESVQLDTREEALDWIAKNQLGRRNLSPENFKLLLGRRYNAAKKTKHDGGKGQKRSGGQIVHHSEKTSERLAREHGVDEKTVRRAGKFQAAAEALGIEKEILSGDVKATEAAVVNAAATLPDKPTPADIEQARKTVKDSGRKRAKGKQPDKPTAGESRRKNERLAFKITAALQTIRGAVEQLAETDSAYREQALAELQRYTGHLSKVKSASAAKPAKSQPTDDLRAAVAMRWEAMRLWAKHWTLADMNDVRRLFVDVIREEQKQLHE